MDLRELHYLIAIAEEKSISRAAERLYMAQSSLSQFLSVTEAHLGYRLFIRTASGVRPTDQGKRLIQFARDTLTEFYRAKDEMQDISELKGGKVILGISSFRGSFLLPPVLQTFRTRYPGIHVQIVEENSLDLEQMLLTGEIDLALLVMPEKHSRIQTRFLMNDEICLITHPSHPVMELVHQGIPPSFPNTSISKKPPSSNSCSAATTPSWDGKPAGFSCAMGSTLQPTMKIFLPCSPLPWEPTALAWPLPMPVPASISTKPSCFPWAKTAPPSPWAPPWPRAATIPKPPRPWIR